MAEYLHTMLRITDPDKSRAFYEALGFMFSRDMDIVRNGEREATNYFFSLGDDENVLELTFNHDGRTYELGDAYGHIAIAVDDLEQSLAELKGQGIETGGEPYRVREGGSLICFVRDPDGYRVELIDRSGTYPEVTLSPHFGATRVTNSRVRCGLWRPRPNDPRPWPHRGARHM